MTPRDSTPMPNPNQEAVEAAYRAVEDAAVAMRAVPPVGERARLRIGIAAARPIIEAEVQERLELQERLEQYEKVAQQLAASLRSHMGQNCGGCSANKALTALAALDQEADHG
jgi:hypothetical protein